MIGTIHEEVKEQDSWSRTYIVLPAVNPAHVTSVMILTTRRASQGVGNIWADAAVESAMRAVVAAGDSLGREAAMMEAAARRRAQDSLRRAGFGDSIRVDTTRLDSLGRPRGDTAAVRPVPRPAAPRPVVPAPRRDTAAVRDTVRRDTLRDTVRRDTLPTRRDTLRPDSLSTRMP
jgi:hypothetical protein